MEIFVGRRRGMGLQPLWRQVAFFAAMPGLVGLGWGQRVENSGITQGNPAPYGRDSNTGWPGTRTMESGQVVLKLRAKGQIALLQAEQRRLMVHEAQTILVVATDLSVGLGNEMAASVKTNEDEVKRAESIEKLARNVRLRMLGGH